MLEAPREAILHLTFRKTNRKARSGAARLGAQYVPCPVTSPRECWSARPSAGSKEKPEELPVAAGEHPGRAALWALYCQHALTQLHLSLLMWWTAVVF